MNTQPPILIVHNDYQQAGGERAAVKAQIDLLRARGHSVHLFWRDNAVIDEYRSLDKALFFPRTIFNSAIYREIRALVEREHIAVAHIHNVFPLISPAVYRALHDAGVPIVQTIHNFRFLCPNALFFTHGRICERCAGGNTLHAVRLRCYRDSHILSGLYAAAIGLHRRFGTFRLIDRAIALTEFVAQKLVAYDVLPAERMTVLGNFLPDHLPPAYDGPREPYVLFMGRLVAEKDPALAIEALAGLPEVKLKVMGSGPLESSLRAEVTRRGMQHVEFLGYVDGERKWDLVRRATALLAPSRWYENFPISLLEAMAMGTPAIAPQLGSMPYLIEHERTGLLTPPGDMLALREAVKRLRANPAFAAELGRAAAKTVWASYSSAAHYQGLHAIYRRVTKSGVYPAAD
ncbi:MAG: glycosyltransferase family 4 protein [Oscillochloris sp.]|nr:glycosyltransferase family 4 protein [Oscillochloris sp.]